MSLVRPNVNDEGYRAIIANGAFGNGLYNPGKKTTNPQLDSSHLDNPTGGDYSCNSKDVLQKVNVSPWTLYVASKAIPGYKVNKGIVRNNIIAIKSSIFQGTPYVFFFYRSAPSRNEWFANNPKLNTAVAGNLKAFQDYSHCSLGAATGRNLNEQDVDSIIEKINLLGYRIVPNGGF